ncbi:tetratricopeptide repeat protein [Flavobacterium sp.]|uniref:tetratricopeptide repeat protein n=1 Tax=Flavobacterium sp. TaxID=239 RepID=UPI0039E67AE4
MTEWYRRKTWTEIDEEEFFAKLSKTRKDGRAQYLKIQAIELVETENEKLLKVAESLLNKMLTEYPDDSFNKSTALKILGDIYSKIGNENIAIEYYKRAIDFEKIYPNVKTQAYLNYAELIVKLNYTSQYDQLKNILLERQNTMVFPIEKFKVNFILSVMYEFQGINNLAQIHAELAEKNASEETSGFTYHKKLGILQDKETWLKKVFNY